MAQTTFEKGVERGIEIAKTTFEKGVERGQRAVLLLMVEHRFGSLSDAVRQRLEAVPADRLLDLGEALLTAFSLRDLGLADE